MHTERYRVPMPEPVESDEDDAAEMRESVPPESAPAETVERKKHVGPIEDAEGEPLSPPPSGGIAPAANENSVALAEGLDSMLREQSPDNNLGGLTVEDVYGHTVADNGEEEIAEPETEESYAFKKEERERAAAEQAEADKELQALDDEMNDAYEDMEKLLHAKSVRLPNAGFRDMLRATLPDDTALRAARERLQGTLNAYVGKVAEMHKSNLRAPHLDDAVIDLVTMG